MQVLRDQRVAQPEFRHLVGRSVSLSLVKLSMPKMATRGSPGSATTVEFVVDRDDFFCHLSYFGAKNAEILGDYYWDTVARRGRDANPYRLGFLQLIGVSESDAAAENMRRTSNISFTSRSTPPNITRRYPATRTIRAWSGACRLRCASASICGRSNTWISSSAAF